MRERQEDSRELPTATTSARVQDGGEDAEKKGDKAGASFSSAVPSWVHFAAGGIGGTLGAVLTCPLEVVKTRLQSTTHAVTLPSGLIGEALKTSSGGAKRWTARLLSPAVAVRNIAKEEGVRGLFRGVDTLIVGVAPTRAVYFLTYSAMKVEMTRLGLSDGPASHLPSAVVAGFVTCTAVNPIHFIRTRLQLQYESFTKGAEKKAARTKNALWVIRTVYREEGLRGFYKGLTASYLGIIENVIQFTLYEFFKKGMAEKKAEEREREAYSGRLGDDYVSSPDENANSNEDGERLSMNQSLSHSDTVIASVGAKVIAAVIAYPHEVLRTRLREIGDSTSLRRSGLPTGSAESQKTGVISLVRSIYQKEGLKALYAGLGINLLKSIPNTAIMFVVYEAIVRWAERKMDA